jgi:hypothetical protein
VVYVSAQVEGRFQRHILQVEIQAPVTQRLPPGDA